MSFSPSVRYLCHGGRRSRGSASCQSLGGVSVDRAVSDAVLEAIEPVGIEAALEALGKFDRQQDERRCQLELSLDKARYEVDRHRRQYDRVDPANRLVAGELEARWNASLKRVAEIEDQLATLPEQQNLGESERRHLLELGADLRSVWEHESANPELKKQILRTVLQEIMIGDDADRRNHQLVLHWKGGVHTELSVKRNKPGKKPNDTSATALELIEELSKVTSDQSIAATLNRLGYKTGGGKTWRLHSVHNARYLHRLTNHRKTAAWVSIERAAQELGVSHTVVRRLIAEKTLPATQVVPTRPWIIARDSLTLPDVQSAVTRVKQGRQLKSAGPRQPELPLK